MQGCVENVTQATTVTLDKPGRKGEQRGGFVAKVIGWVRVGVEKEKKSMVPMGLEAHMVCTSDPRKLGRRAGV